MRVRSQRIRRQLSHCLCVQKLPWGLKKCAFGLGTEPLTHFLDRLASVCSYITFVDTCTRRGGRRAQQTPMQGHVNRAAESAVKGVVGSIGQIQWKGAEEDGQTHHISRYFYVPRFDFFFGSSPRIEVNGEWTRRW